MIAARVTFSPRNLREYNAKLSAWRELYARDPEARVRGTFTDSDGVLCFLWGCGARVVRAGRDEIEADLGVEGRVRVQYTEGLQVTFE